MKILLLTFLLLPNCYAQSSTSNVWKTLFTDQIGNAISSNVKNTGQAFHILYGYIGGVVGSCSPITGVFVQLEGSYDNAVFTAIGKAGRGTLNSDGLSSTGFVTTYGSGSYPYVRARITKNPGNCKLTAFYSGALNTQSFQSAVTSRGLNATVVPFSNTFGGAGTAILLDLSTSVQPNGIFVMGLLDLHTTGGAIVTFIDNGDPTCVALGTTIYILSDASAGSKGITLPWSDYGYYRSGIVNRNICIAASAATTVSGLLGYWIEN